MKPFSSRRGKDLLPLQRRDFVRWLSACGVGLSLPGRLWADEPPTATPAQIAGPFYPVPEIGQQPFHDPDLTRKMGDDEVAKGQLLVVRGTVRDLSGRPLDASLVEVWQACTTGRYHHPRDDNPARLDEHFQFWGRVVTGESGEYEFRTIKPGAYPGRTPHIHFRILAPRFSGLVTQMYFSDESRANARDGIYRRLSRPQRDAVTIEFAKLADQPDTLLGHFDIVMSKS